MSSSMLDEDLCTSNDSDFSDIFSNSDVSSSDLDELEVVVKKDKCSPSLAIEVEATPVVEEEPENTVKKRRGRPKKSEEENPKEEKEPVAAAPVAVKRGRGRPPKKAVEAPQTETDEEKKTRSKRVSVDDFPPEVLNQVFEQYSLKPAAEIAEELGIQEKYVHKIIKRLTELFEMAVSTGDLTQEDFDNEIAPKISGYHEPKDNFEAFVKTKVKSIKNN